MKYTVIDVVLALIVILAMFFIAAMAGAHGHYEKLRDPMTGLLCCGGEDCAVLKIEPGVLSEGEPDGYRLRLTEEQARKINPNRNGAVDTVIPLSRVQQTPPGWSADFHVCIPSYRDNTRPIDVLCFWAPPNS